MRVRLFAVIASRSFHSRRSVNFDNKSGVVHISSVGVTNLLSFCNIWLATADYGSKHKIIKFLFLDSDT